jgi:hypothetical protein
MILPSYLSGSFGFDVWLYGDFTVCPFSPDRRGEMRMVCIEEAHHLVGEKRFRGNVERPSYLRLGGCSLDGQAAGR